MPAPKISLRKIEALTPDPLNARTHSPEQLDIIVGSINRFGWTNPVLADDLIRAGHGRVAAAGMIYADGGRVYMAPGKEAGGTLLPKDTVPVIDCTGWSDTDRRAYALADNQIALQAGWDYEALGREIEALTADQFDIGILGFDATALEALATEGGAEHVGRQLREMEDSTFNHVDQFAVIVRCADAAEQEQRFAKLRDEYGADQVKVVVV